MTDRLRRYHAAVWDEPLVMELGQPGRRGAMFPPVEPELDGRASATPTRSSRRRCAATTRPALPELSEPEVQRHYLHLSQETLGMMGISLFGTCTMKYNPRVPSEAVATPSSPSCIRYQPEDTLQGIARDRPRASTVILRELSGMDRSCSRPAAAPTRPTPTPASPAPTSRHAASSRSATRSITSIQAHPCNAATAAAAGFKVVTLMLEENGYPSIDALKAAVSERTAALMINNPDDMGIYNPRYRASGCGSSTRPAASAFYDHANFNGVMGKIRARELGFDACMFMLHKTFGAPKGGRRPGGRRLRLHRRAAPVPAGPGRRRGGRAATASTGPAAERRQGARVLGQCPAGREGLCLGAGDGRRRHRRGLRPVGAGQQLHGEAARSRSAASPARTRTSPSGGWR